MQCIYVYMGETCLNSKMFWNIPIGQFFANPHGQSMVINVWWNAVRHFYRPSLLILVRHLFWPIQREKHGWNMWNAVGHFSICPFLGPTWVKHGWNLWNAVKHFSIGPFLGPTWVKHGWNLCEMLWSMPTYQFSAKSKKPKREEKKPNCRDSAFLDYYTGYFHSKTAIEVGGYSIPPI